MTKQKSKNINSFMPLIIIIILLSLFISASNISLLVKNPKQSVVLAKIAPDYEDEKAYWMEIIQKHPDYLPAYIELIKIERSKGNTTAAKIYEAKAKNINPNLIPLLE